MKHISEYEKYLELVKEGLTRTHNIEKYKSSLDIEFNSIGVKYDINVFSKFIYEITILNPDFFDKDGLEYIVNINRNLLGYYPSYIWVENNIGINGFKYNDKYLNNKYKTIRIRFEAKYDDGLYTNDLDVPEYAYHLSPSKYKDKILNIGLYPKTKKRKSDHPDRIYFLYDIENKNELLKSLKLNDFNNGNTNVYILYKVKIPNDIIIHSDPNYDGGFYIYDSIPPKNIEIIEENL